MAVLCLPLHAGVEWLRIRSTTFELLTTAGENKGREAILFFEAVRKFFADSKLVKNMPTTPVRIVGFRSEKEYRPYAVNEAAAAYYQPGLQHDYIVMSNIDAESFPGAVHEYTHLLVEHSGAKLPVWLNEGLADVFSSLRPMGKKIQLGAILPGRLMELQQSKLIPLPVLFAVDHNSPLYNERNRASMFYSESWALTHMIELSTVYRPHAPEFLRAIIQGSTPVEAFTRVYGKTLDEVNKDLTNYVHGGGKFVTLIFNQELDRKSEDPDVDTMPAWDAQFALAEILSSSIAREGAGRMMLEQLAREDPKRWEPEAALGTLDVRHFENAKATAHFERAVQLGATDPRMFFEYGMNLRESDKVKSIAMLQKALALKPDYEDAHFFLGFEYMNTADYMKALVQFAQVKSVKEANAFVFFQSVAYANYKIGRKDEARAALESAKKYATDDRQREELEQLLAAIDQRPLEQPPQEAENKVYNGTELSAPQAQPHLPTSTGMFTELVCEGETARMAVSNNGAVTWFAMDDPHAIAIHSGSNSTIDLNCGRQKPRRVTVHYVATPDADKKTAGLVRAIDFDSGEPARQ